MASRMGNWLLLAAWLVFCLGNPSVASVSVTGEFAANKECGAYQSIRKKTNPDGMRLEIGERYPVFEVNVSPSPTWYHIRIDEAVPPDRWVYFECGAADVAAAENHVGPTGSNTNAAPGAPQNPCHTAGLEDSYVLALSWQPAFCESHKEKPECSVADPQSYQARNFTLHGLWPNKAGCGANYGFCGQYKAKLDSFCAYDEVPVQPDMLEKLGQFMPSAAHGSCLQRHEWYKHGTCQTKWNADAYFDTAIRLLEEFNNAGMAKFMTDNLGTQVTTDAFFNAVDTAFGENAHRRLEISCTGGKLVDIYLHLPLDISENASLGNLMQQAEPEFKNKCGAGFEVDAIGFQ